MLGPVINQGGRSGSIERTPFPYLFRRQKVNCVLLRSLWGSNPHPGTHTEKFIAPSSLKPPSSSPPFGNSDFGIGGGWADFSRPRLEGWKEKGERSKIARHKTCHSPPPPPSPANDGEKKRKGTGKRIGKLVHRLFSLAQVSQDRPAEHLRCGVGWGGGVGDMTLGTGGEARRIEKRGGRNRIL